MMINDNVSSEPTSRPYNLTPSTLAFKKQNLQTL